MLLLAPIAVLVVLAPRSRPGGNDVPRAPTAVEQAAITVMVNEEESFWTPYSSGTGSMRFEGHVAPSSNRGLNRDEPVPAERLRPLARDPLPLDLPEASRNHRQVETGEKRGFEMRHVRRTFGHHAQSRRITRYGRHTVLVRLNESSR